MWWGLESLPLCQRTKGGVVAAQGYSPPLHLGRARVWASLLRRAGLPEKDRRTPDPTALGGWTWRRSGGSDRIRVREGCDGQTGEGS